MTPIRVERWPTEMPLFALTVVAAAFVWMILIFSLIGIFYAVFLGLLFFLIHLGFIAHVRGSAVRIGPDQFPELHERVATLARRMGMKKIPDVYLMQAGGALNALATRFLGAHLVILFSELLEACGGDKAARDMIIAHELGHIHANHLRLHWLLLPGLVIPFLGHALSRARELTCDRYGLAGAGDSDGALLGLTILAAGGRYGRLVNRESLMRQRADMDTGLMTIGEWLMTHPPLSRRMLALDPARRTDFPNRRGARRAAAIVTVALVLPMMGAGAIAAFKAPAWMAAFRQEMSLATASSHQAFDPAMATAELHENFAAIAAFLATEQAAGRDLPNFEEELYAKWMAAFPGRLVPIDPFSGYYVGYSREQHGYSLWSAGPDHMAGTEDDIAFRP